MAMYTCPWCEAHEEPVPNPEPRGTEHRRLNPWACSKCDGVGGWEDFDSETNEERIARWESLGAIAKDCEFCQREFYAALPMRDGRVEMPFMPRHTALSSCRSGRRDHCTCDGCF